MVVRVIGDMVATLDPQVENLEQALVIFQGGGIGELVHPGHAMRLQGRDHGSNV